MCNLGHIISGGQPSERGNLDDTAGPHRLGKCWGLRNERGLSAGMALVQGIEWDERDKPYARGNGCWEWGWNSCGK